MYYHFSGIAVDELYLIRAESRARLGDAQGALNDVNEILKNRWSKETLFVPLTITPNTNTIDLVLTERRKELPFRSVRFTDLRRLNRRQYNIPVTRIVNNETITLPPNSKLYVLPFPPEVIYLSGIPQNER